MVYSGSLCGLTRLWVVGGFAVEGLGAARIRTFVFEKMLERLS